MKLLKLLLFTFTMLLLSCSNDDELKPISLTDRGDTIIRLTYPNEYIYSYTLVGGDGKYSIKSGDTKIVKAEMTSTTNFSLTMVAIGETIVTITDNSQNTLVLTFFVDYYTLGFAVVENDINIVGGDLTENEKKAITEKCLSEMPAKVGGGYKFIYNNVPNDSKAIIYPDSYGYNGIETIFTIKEIENPQGIKIQAYEVVINNEKRVFVLQRYKSNTKMEYIPPQVWIEDVTQKVQAEYPKVESILAGQVVSRK